MRHLRSIDTPVTRDKDEETPHQPEHAAEDRRRIVRPTDVGDARSDRGAGDTAGRWAGLGPIDAPGPDIRASVSFS